MKKLLLLLFVHLMSFSQIKYSDIQITYKDLMKLDSKDAFEKLMFDARFSATEGIDDDALTYALDLDDEDKSKAFAWYYERTGAFFFQFSKPNELLESFGYVTNIYEEILKKVERKCKFVKMYKISKDNYACYDCKQAEYNGLLGFTVANGVQMTVQIPNGYTPGSK